MVFSVNNDSFLSGKGCDNLIHRGLSYRTLWDIMQHMKKYGN